jgi:hypothetical protein
MRSLATLILVGTGLSIVTAGSAVARPRDEVLAGAFRCAPVSDARTWLDCYYGAAQPVRATLGLPSAPAGQAALRDSLVNEEPLVASRSPRARPGYAQDIPRSPVQSSRRG